jgi:ribosomal protein L37E
MTQANCQICGSRPAWTADTVVCGVCFGFEKEEETIMPPKKNNLVCNRCGRSSDEVKFYPSRKDRCASCIVEITRENREKYQQAASNAATPAPEGSGEKTLVGLCRDCGCRFEPYRNGVALITGVCRVCLKKNIRDGRASSLKQSNPFEVVLNFAEEEHLLSIIAALAKKERRTLPMQILSIVEQSLVEKE